MKVDAGRDFGTRECPSCATEVPANNNRCPICGYGFPQATPLQTGLRIGGALLMLGLILLAIALSVF